PILTLIFLLISTLTFSQNYKLGEFEDSEISLTEVSYEPGAPAVLLVSQGNSGFISGYLETSHLVSFKILSEGGKEYADVRIRYYVGDQGTEDILAVKAQTTNFVNGEAESVKVSKEGIFEVDLDDGYKELRISFPNVQVGSIIEYQYKKT